MQRRHAVNHSLDCIVSRLWLVYKSVARRGLRAGRAAFLGIAGHAQGEVRRCQCDRILAALVDPERGSRGAARCGVRGQSGETAMRALGCYRPEAIAWRKHRAMVFAAAPAAGRNTGFLRQQHGQSQSRKHQDKQQTCSKTAHEQKNSTTSQWFVMTTAASGTAEPDRALQLPRYNSTRENLRALSHPSAGDRRDRGFRPGSESPLRHWFRALQYQ